MGSLKMTENVKTLVDMFKCLICHEKVQDAHLCPHCSKLCCYECIRCWLVDHNKNHCPNCRRELQLHQLVKWCWGEEVIEQLDTLRNCSKRATREVNSEYSRCSEHQKKLTLYCENCQKCLCRRCELQHPAAHVLKPLNKVYEEHRSRMKKDVAQLEQRQSNLKSRIQEVNRNEKCVKLAKDKIVREIVNILDKLDDELKDKLSVLKDRKNSLKSEDERISAQLQKINVQLKFPSKLELINEAKKLSQETDQICQNPLWSFRTAPISADFQSWLQIRTPIKTAALPSVTPPATPSSTAVSLEATTPTERTSTPVQSKPLSPSTNPLKQAPINPTKASGGQLPSQLRESRVPQLEPLETILKRSSPTQRPQKAFKVSGSTQKHYDFVTERMDGKPVTALAGIGQAYGAELQKHGYYKAKDVLQKFLALKKDERDFKSWLYSVSRANSQWSNHCYLCLRDYCDNFL